jgi:antirestriction protein ArdC
MNTTELYASITEKIIANLETSGSWTKLWDVPAPVSLMGYYYKGINRLILSTDNFKSRVYGTFAQIRSNGGMVRKGEKATIIVFWKKSVGEDKDTKDKKNLFLLKYYHIFNTEQADFDEIGTEKVANLNGLVNDKFESDYQDAQAIVEGYPNPPDIHFDAINDNASYSPVADMITIPPQSQFINTNAYFRVLFHEYGHSTGHPKRLNRFEAFSNSFGDIPYSKEELVAELCSAYLSGIAKLGLENRNSIAYIRNWATALRDNEKWIMWAASRAEKAANHILGIVEVHIVDEAEVQQVPEFSN